MNCDLLFEIGTEELPSAAVLPLAMALADNVVQQCDSAQLQHAGVRYFATPRRIAVVLHALADNQPEQFISKKGPMTKAALDADGQPTKALLGFARSCQVGVDALIVKETDKGAWWYYEAQVAGEKTVALLPALIKAAVAKLPVPKLMRWGAGNYDFARPVHWIMALYGSEIVNLCLFGVDAGDETHGHRFHAPQAFKIKSPQDYQTKLESAFVYPDFASRQQFITDKVQTLAKEHGFRAVMPQALVDEVTSIVEWPVALLVPFAKKFLDIPSEVLIASMQSHQKCFALEDSQGNLQPYFITVSNIQSKNPEQVIAGNEKVMHARLSDAAFFYQQDKLISLDAYRLKTATVVFQKGLGSLLDKSERMQQLAIELATTLGLDTKEAERAAHLSKCDLMTGMVGEFPELQGLMGSYYVLHDGEPVAVATAICEQYMPRFAGDNLPDTALGFVLSLVDRVDTLVGCFAIGQRPTGEKDPFKLRRHALAVVRLLVNQPVHFDLSELIAQSLAVYADSIKPLQDTQSALKNFIFERLQSFYHGQNVTSDLVDAARACQSRCLFDLNKRIGALSDFIRMPESESLAFAAKRVNNLLQRVPEAEQKTDIRVDLFVESAEIDLNVALSTIIERIAVLDDAGSYVDTLRLLATLRTPLDAFFDSVMVMAEDPLLKQNRIALLIKLRKVLQHVADISLLSSSTER